MAHRCSYCGVAGHKRPTCPEYRAVKNGLKLDPVLSPFEEATRSDFSPGDYVEVVASTPPWEGRRYEVRVSAANDPYNCNCVTVIDPDNGKDLRFYPENLRSVNSLDIPFEGDNEYVIAEVYSSSKDDAGIDMSKIDCWTLIEAVIPNEKRTLLYGPPGTGKTTAGNFAGNPREVFNVTLTEETPAAEIRGHYVPRGGEFHWQDGPAMTAYRNGARLILNEIDKASVDCLTFCYALLDDPSISMITLPTGETVKPHPDFSCVATTNGVPEDLPDALKDRLAVRIFVPTPHPEAVKSLPEDLRKPAKKGFGKPGSPSFREWKAYAGLREKIGSEFAAKAVWGERAETVLNTLRIGAKAGVN